MFGRKQEVKMEELCEQTQHAIELVMIDNNKFVDKCIREYLNDVGIKVEPGSKGLHKVKNVLDNMGYELEIKVTNLDINEENIGHVTANQILRLKLKPKLEA